MVKSVDTLVQDLQNLFKGHSVGEGLLVFKDQIGEVFINRLKDKEHQSRNLSLSMIGKPLRQLYYELTKAPREELSVQTKIKFLYGDVIESMMAFLIQEAGHTLTDQQKTVEIGGVEGHIDGILNGDTLIDIKSCSPYSFEKFRNGELKNNDPFGYIGQLSAYWACLPEIKRAGFFAFDKQSGRMHFMELSKNERKSEDDVRSRITTVHETIDRGVEPEFCYPSVPLSKSDKSGNLVLQVGCAYCAFKFYCHRDANNGEGLKTFHYSTGPKFFTKIVKTPRVPEAGRDEETTDTFPIK